MIELTKAMKKLIAEGLIAESGPLDGVKVMLFKNDIVPDENTTFADLVPCDYTGYADSDVIVWGDPYLDGDSGEWAVSCPPVEFRSTAGSPYVSSLAYGYAVYLPGTPNVLRFAERFDEPEGFPFADRVLVVRPELIGLGGDSLIAS